jgi:methionyl-tRNA formyltransferase
MNRRRLVFMGTPDFAVPPLQALAAAGHEVTAVFTQPDKPAGRGRQLATPPVKVAAQALNIPVFQPPSLREPEVISRLEELSPEVIVVAAYAQLLPTAILELPPFGCKNIHASLLPKYRGGAPVHWAIANGETETGVTIMQMARGLDTGDIILKQVYPLGPDETCGEVTNALSHLGAKLMLECLELPDLGASLRRPQDEAESCFARNVLKSDGRINWYDSARLIHNRVRGFNPWPGAHTLFLGQPLRLLSTSSHDHVNIGAPGIVTLEDGKCMVGTGAGALEIRTVLPAGKRAISGLDFYRGYIAKLPPEKQSLGE